MTENADCPKPELNQNLFNLMHDKHGLILTQSEMEDIKTAIRKDKADYENIRKKLGIRFGALRIQDPGVKEEL